MVWLLDSDRGAGRWTVAFGGGLIGVNVATLICIYVRLLDIRKQIREFENAHANGKLTCRLPVEFT